MDGGEAPDSRGERLYQRSWVSQQPTWYLELFRIWWLNGVYAAVVCGWAVRAWADAPPPRIRGHSRSSVPRSSSFLSCSFGPGDVTGSRGRRRRRGPDRGSTDSGGGDRNAPGSVVPAPPSYVSPALTVLDGAATRLHCLYVDPGLRSTALGRGPCRE